MELSDGQTSSKCYDALRSVFLFPAVALYGTIGSPHADVTYILEWSAAASKVRLCRSHVSYATAAIWPGIFQSIVNDYRPISPLWCIEVWIESNSARAI